MISPLSSWWSTYLSKFQHYVKTLRTKPNGCSFQTKFSLIFLHETGCIFIQISLKCISHGSIDNNPLLGKIMACRAKWLINHYISQQLPLFSDTYMVSISSMLVYGNWEFPTNELFKKYGLWNYGEFLIYLFLFAFNQLCIITYWKWNLKITHMMQ